MRRDYSHSILVFVMAFICSNLWALSPLKEAEDRRDLQAPALREAIVSKQKEFRAAAARALGRIQKPESIPDLFSLLDDPEVIVRKEAAFALGQLGWSEAFAGGQEKLIAQKLSAKLNTKENDLKKLLVEALGKIALEETPQYVIPLLNDSDSAVRAESIVALYRYRLVIKLRNPDQIPTLLNDDQMQKLLDRMHDSSSRVVKYLAFYFSRVTDPRGKDVVLNLCESKDLWARYYAVSALSRLDGDDVLAAALAASDDENASVRVAALQALTHLKAISSLDPSLRGDPSYHVRSAYADALGSAPEKDSGSLKTLKELLLDSSPSVKAEALKSIATLKDDGAYDLLKSYLENKFWVLRQASAEATAFLEDAQKRELLNVALIDSDVRVRTSALEILGELDGSDAYKAIKAALNSDQLSERGTAVSALGDRSESERFSDAFETYKNSSDEKWTELREDIVSLWDSTLSDETSTYLKEAINDPASSVALMAYEALKKRGIDEQAPTLQQKLSFSPYRELQFKKNPKIILETSKGSITLELYYKAAPIHVANMVGFAKEGHYNGLPIHRVVSNFVVQGGDPDKTGWGSAGYSLRAEINTLPFERGSLGMPRSTGFDTGGVQFFINHVPTPNLDGQYTVFGKVSDGLEVLDQLEVGDLILSTTVL